MSVQIEKLKTAIAPYREQIINHKVYNAIKNQEDLKVFMQFHVYAVWDFMSLLKTLQNNLTCTAVPWFPTGNADTRYLINEIVNGEESDIDDMGIRKSHFEIYLDAMKQCGSDTTPIHTFTSVLRKSKDFKAAFLAAGTYEEAVEFVDFTFNIIDSEQWHLQSAIFTFGREDLIPGMFYSIVKDIDMRFPDSVSKFKYYLERHIEVDGDHHSHLALQMTANLCGTNEDYWMEAEKATIASLQKRIKLWDGVYNQITNASKELQPLSENTTFAV